MIINTTSIRDFILTNYSQVELFSKYMGIPEGDILNCIHNNKRVKNVLRNEENASLTFTFYDNKLRMHDYGANEYRGDIFDLVGLIIGESSYNRQGFIKICKYIISNGNITNIVNVNPTHKKNRNIIISVIPKNFDTFDFDFWMVGLHTNLELLKREGVYSLLSANVFANDEEVYYYRYQPTNPSYAYFFDSVNNKNLIKLFFPKKNKKEGRYITNNKYDFEGINALYKSDYLVITKGYKERIILRNYLPNNYCITNFSSESVLLTREQLAGLLTIYKQIFINVDYDTTGIVNSFYHSYRANLHNVKKVIPIFINKNIPKIIADNKTVHLYNELKQTSTTLTLDTLIEKLSAFTIEHKGEYEEKDLFDLAKTISPKVMKEYIKYKFKINNNEW